MEYCIRVAGLPAAEEDGKENGVVHSTTWIVGAVELNNSRILRWRVIGLVALTVALVAGCRASLERSDQGLWFNARINGQPVKLVFDTGSNFSVLHRKSAERLGLKIIKRPTDAPAPKPGQIAPDRTEEFALTLCGTELPKCTFGVIDIPDYVRTNFDGFMSWGDLRDNVIEIGHDGGVWRVLPKLPADLSGWQRWKLASDEGLLVFECGNGAAPVRIVIDTGSPFGVELNPERWRDWRAAHVRRPTTMEAAYSPVVGHVVYEVSRAEEIELGGIRFPDVPVSECWLGGFQRYDAVLGMFALTRLKVIIDGKDGALYIRPVARPSAMYKYNLLGAVFVPPDPEKDDELIAHVSEGSPAYVEGIRDGDRLLKIGEEDVTTWRTDPRGLGTGNWGVGTELKLTLKRGAEVYEKTVTLAEPLPN